MQVNSIFIIIYLITLTYSPSVICQTNYSKTFNYLSGNEAAHRLFKFDDGYQIYGSGIRWDTLEDGTIDYHTPDYYSFVDKQGELINSIIDNNFHADVSKCHTQIQDTVLYRMRAYTDDSLRLYSYFRDRYGDSSYVSKSQAMDYNGFTHSICKSGDTLYALIGKRDIENNQRTYYQKLDIWGNIFFEMEIIEPNIAHLPSGGWLHLVYGRSIVVNENNTILISYTYHNFGEFAVLLKMKTSGALIWRKDLKPNIEDIGWQSNRPDISMLEDGNFIVLWKYDIPIDSVRWDVPIEQSLYLLPSVVLKIDQEGNTIWKKTFFTNKLEQKYVQKIIEAKNGDLIGIGFYNRLKKQYQAVDQYYAWMFRMNTEGVVLWEHYYNDETYGGHTDFNDVIEEEDGSIVVVGSIENDNLNYKYNNSAYQWFLKINGDGCYYNGTCDEAVVIGTPKLLSNRNIWHIKTGGANDNADIQTVRYALDNRRIFSFVDSITGAVSKLNYAAVQISDEIVGTEWVGYTHYIRQVGEKVYLFNYFTKQRGLLYDFALEVGDVFKTKHFQDTSVSLLVTHVDTIHLDDGNPRRRLTLRCSGDMDGEAYGYKTWIQGIGDTKGLLSHVDYCCTTDTDGSELLCYNSYDRTLYQSDNYSSCWVMTALDDLEVGTELIYVYPNPTADILSVILDRPIGMISWSIVDIAGKTMLSGVENQNVANFIIDLSSLSNQMCFLQLRDKKGMLLGVNKLIIQH